MTQLSPIGLCTVAYSFARLRYAPRAPPPPPPPLTAADHDDGQHHHQHHSLHDDNKGKATNSASTAAAAWWRHFVEVASNSLIDFSPWELSQLVRSLMVQGDVPKETLLTPAFLTLTLKCAVRTCLCMGSVRARCWCHRTHALSHTHVRVCMIQLTACLPVVCVGCCE